jgi:hypothetical protein
LPGRSVRHIVRALERAEPQEQWAALCFLAGGHVDLDEDEANAALRRAELLLAAGGDPRRELELYGRATTAVARDLDTSERRHQLAAGLEALEPELTGLRGAAEALRLLLANPELAWQCFAASLLADELGS